MLLLMETWSAACCWFPDCTNCSIVRPDSDSSCSIQVSGNARAGLCPCSRRANSDDERGRHRRVRPRHVRDHQNQALRILARRSPVIWSAQESARFRSIRPAAMRAATRRRFSINARRSMMGMAHNSPSLRAVTVW